MTPAEFKARFPAFASEADERVQDFIDDADPYFDVDRWGGFYSAGLGYFVAHKIVLANVAAGQGTSGKATATDILTKKVGEVEIQRDTGLLNLQAKDPFMRTLYGQEYKALALQVGIGAVSV